LLLGVCELLGVGRLLSDTKHADCIDKRESILLLATVWICRKNTGHYTLSGGRQIHTNFLGQGQLRGHFKVTRSI